MMTKVYRCSNGHYLLDDIDVPFEECDICGSTDIQEMADPNQLMQEAERITDDPFKYHRLADQALYLRMVQLDPEFAQRYERVRERGFWYA